MLFKSTPLKMITFGRGVVRFDKEGFYNTDDKDKIEEIKKFDGVDEVKKSKE